uniref:Putative glycosyltransferase n=1 Tax=viral metagenome TaxID=1070528 RepID=A0A6M3IX96_9ZZZZ
MMKPTIKVIAAANNFHFINDLVPALSDAFDIQMIQYRDGFNKFVLDSIESADLVWLEWADGISTAILSSNIKFKKVILRLHRYELFTPRTLRDLSALSDEAISKIDQLVFVSEYVKQIGIQKFPWMTKGKVIPNLIDTSKFPFIDRQNGYNIMMLGRMSYVKNLPLALTMFHELLKLDDNYHLHIVGEISDPELGYYSGNFVNKTGMKKNVHFHGRIDNDKLPEFMKDMHFILCTSIFESFGMGILEAMCSGLKPVIFDFPGAETMFIDKWRWLDRTGFVQNIISHNYLPLEYNYFVVNEFSIKNKIHLYKNLISETLKGE